MMFQKRSHATGLSLIGIGLVLLVVVSAYTLYSAWVTSSLDDRIIEDRSSLGTLFPAKSEIHISNTSNPNNLSQQITLPVDLEVYLEETRLLLVFAKEVQFEV